MPRWKAKGWKTVSGTEVKNKDMFILLNDQIESLASISWVKYIILYYVFILILIVIINFRLMFVVIME